MKTKVVGRRDFGKVLGAGVAGALAPASAEAIGETEPGQFRTETPEDRVDAFTFFTREEADFVDAAVDRLIPADELGPGAREAGVTVFIDRQLSGAWGNAANWYMLGPWGESLPEQGYQLPLTPRELYRLAIAEVNAISRSRHDERFDNLEPAQQENLLEEMESGALPVESAPVAEFFATLLANCMEGFFSDPIYGGNRDKVGWRLVGFPGVGASYRDRVERHGEPYDVEPVGIQDVVEGRAGLDRHGHVLHEARRRRSAAGEE